MNPSTAQATVLVDELVRCGVRQFVVCPGSRNAPLSMALARAADAGRLTLHVRIDERSAGFFALGLAKAGRSVAVVVTSGTAVANLHPAVLEAHHTRKPVLLLTADRPVELLPTGANQVIDARAVFGGAATLVDFPIAETRTGQNAMWRALVCRAVAATATGPVQVNVPLRDPLVPDGDNEWLEPLTGRPDDRPWTTLPTAPEPAGEPLPDLGPRPLLVLGDGNPALLTDAARTAAQGGWPVLAEPTATTSALAAGAELITHGTLVVNADTLALQPTGLVVAGRPTLTRWVGRLMRTVGVVHVVDDNPQWTDAGHAATSVSRWLRPADLVARQADPAWLAAWRDADDAANRAVTKFLGEAPWPTGLRAAREIVAALPPDAVLFLGSSNPVRLVDLVAAPRADLLVYANRGVAGIDGSVSTANGLTLGLGARGYALLGDLTFLHDANGLLLGPDEQRPDLTVIVLNDVGGGIFSLLEQGAPEHEASFERVFGTPHQVDIAQLCAAHGVPHRRAESIDDLVAAISAQGGLRVIEVPVPRDGIREFHAALAAAVRDAIR
ncbi:MAG TPA: 2-succinyl-5-enolpyruvyl-6-hydroxy-3-cyclohexene-1-carboxylic-acid synthase [Pseudonocardiaceae bacterium]|nr:2-succinyl-5-enolpyruvyl-6-hydroxy-3-cyclohexene-1-carboxylic-acid synthase [Pseudonocardiaceae bacterium]